MADIRYSYEGQVYSFKEGTTPEEAKKKILKYLGRTSEAESPVPPQENPNEGKSDLRLLGEDIARNAVSGKNWATLGTGVADLFSAGIGMAAAAPYGIGEAVKEGSFEKGVEAFHAVSSAMNPLSGEFQYKELNPIPDSLVEKMDELRSTEHYQAMNAPFAAIPQGYGNIAALAASPFGDKVAGEAGSGGELAILTAMGAMGIPFGKRLGGKVVESIKAPTSPGETAPAVTLPKEQTITMIEAAKSQLPTQKLNLEKAQGQILEISKKLEALAPDDAARPLLEKSLAEAVQRAQIAQKAVGDLQKISGGADKIPPVGIVPPTRVDPTSEVPSPAGQSTAKPRLKGPSAVIREIEDVPSPKVIEDSAVKAVVDDIASRPDLEQTLRDYEISRKIDDYTSEGMKNKPIPESEFTPGSDRWTVNDRKERIFSDENPRRPLSNWDTPFITDTAYPAAIAKYKKYSDTPGMYRGPAEGAKAISELIARESIAPLKAEMQKRIEQYNRQLAMGEKPEYASAMLGKIKNALGEAEFNRLSDIAKENQSYNPRWIETGREKLWHDEQLATKLTEEGNQGTLKYLSERYKGNSFGILAKALLDNSAYHGVKIKFADELHPTTQHKLGFSKDLFAGIIDKKSGDIVINNKYLSSPEVFLHEYVHNATTPLLDLVPYNPSFAKMKLALNRAKITNIKDEAIRAALNLHDLYNELVLTGRHKHIDSNALSSAGELVAWGTTNHKVMAQLSAIQVKPSGGKITNALNYLFTKVREILGINKDPKVRTAFEEVFSNTMTMIEAGTGRRFSEAELRTMGHVGYGKGIFSEYDAMRTGIQKALQDRDLSVKPKATDAQVKQYTLNEPDSPSYFFSKRWYGFQQFAQQIKDNPLLFRIGNAIRYADDVATQYKSIILHGSRNKISQPGNLGPFTTLERVTAGDSPSVLINTLPISDWIPVMKHLQHGAENRIPYATNLANNGQHLTAKQRQLFSSLTDAYARDLNVRNRYLPPGQQQTPTINPATQTPRMEGWHHLVRKGDFDVLVHYLGTNLYAQRVLTRMEAEGIKKKVLSDPNWRGANVDIIDRTAEKKLSRTDYYQALKDRATSDELAGREPAGYAARKHAELDAEMARGGKLGGHDLYRTGMPGYEGKKLYKSDIENAKEFRKGFLDYVDEMGSLLKKRIIHNYTDALLTDADIIAQRPNAHSVAKYLQEIATNDYQSYWSNFDVPLRRMVDTFVTKSAHLVGFKDYYPSVHVLDKTHGVAAHLFYIFALTSRPGFWLAQVLSGPQSLRQVFRTPNTLEAMASVGRGMWTIATGGDTAFREAVHWVRQNTNTFHPQFINELNSLAAAGGHAISDSAVAKFLQTWIPRVTGERIGGIADAISRYTSFAMLYEHHKALGKTGIDLYKAAAEGTDTAMVMYNSPNKAPILKKAGLLGETIAPLQTFAQAQLGNIVADTKYMIRNKTLASTMPFLVTGLTTVLMGGAIGLPFIAEWELMRRLLMAYDPSLGEVIPSPLDYLHKDEVIEAKKIRDVTVYPEYAVSYGLPSAMTGWDVGSGLRWNAIISKSLSGEQSILDMLPAVSWGFDFAKHSITMAKDLFPNSMVSREEYRQAAMFFGGAMVGGKYLVDKTMFDADTRKYVVGGPGSPRGAALVRQTPEESAGTLIGSKVVSSKHIAESARIEKEQNDIRQVRQRKAIDIMVDAVEGKVPMSEFRKGVRELLDIKVNPDEINANLEKQYQVRNTPYKLRYFTNSKGAVTSYEQQRRYLQQRQYFGR